MNEGVTAPWKVELHNMVQIYDCISVDAQEMVRIQSRADVFDRHSMFISCSLQVQPEQISMALNPQYVTNAYQNDLDRKTATLEPHPSCRLGYD